jgi:uncharacterized membrane protein
MSKCLIAEYDTSAAAKVALEILEVNAFTLETVSVVSKATDPAVKHLRELENESSSQNRPTSLGMLLGGTIAAPIAAGTLIGPFIIAGPLVGMALGAAIGGLVGSMQRWGVADDISADYEKRVRAGSVLIIVHDVDIDRLREAREQLVSTDPKSLESYELSTDAT